MGLIWSNQTCEREKTVNTDLILGKATLGMLDRGSSVLSFTHHHLLLVLKLQAKVVTLNEIHVGAHEVKQHLA